MSSINSASSPNSVLLNSSQTLSSGSPALCCPWNAAVGLRFCWGVLPHTSPMSLADTSHVCTIAPSFLEDFHETFCSVTLKHPVSRAQTLSWSCRTPTQAFSFFFSFVSLPLSQLNHWSKSFSCLLGYSNERKWQSKADNIYKALK